MEETGESWNMSSSGGTTNSSFITSEFPFENVTFSVTSESLNTTTKSIPVYTLASDTWPENSTNVTMSLGVSSTGMLTPVYDTIINATTPDESLLESEEAMERAIQFWIGVGLSVSSSLFIGLSFIIKKKALIRLSVGGRRANQGGYGYLKDLLWWSGLLSMAIGEAANFMAYTFAPASLVSTLGVLSVLVTAILSSRYLRERLNFLGKIGCFLCAIGSTVIVIHAPMEKDIESMLDLEEKLTNFMFVVYVLITVIVSIILIYHYRPKLPETSTYTLLIWIGVCSMIGSLSVMSVKGLGLALFQTVTGTENQLNNWLTWFCFLAIIICVTVQMNFLNKALDTFNTAVVTPIYYVFFTSCVIIASSILFNEFAYLPAKDWIGLICGFLTVLSAILMLHLCKNFDFTLVSLAQQIDLVNEEKLNFQKEGFTSCAIPRNESDLKLNLVSEKNEYKSRNELDGDDETTTDEVYRSVESCGSRCSRGMGVGGSSSSMSSLSPDIGLLSGSYANSDQRGRRNKDGYVALSYGTTDNDANIWNIS